MPSDTDQKGAVAALDPAKAVAQPQKAAKRAEASGSVNDLETAAKAALVDGSRTSKKSTSERLDDARDGIVADRKEAKRQKMTDAEQSSEFERVAREHGAEGDEETFNASLRKLVKAKKSAG